MLNKLIYAFLSLALILGACAGENAQAKWKPKSLLQYGVPVTILAPDSVTVETMDFKVQRDITVDGGEDYALQIFASEASTSVLSELKANQLEEIKANPYFSEIVSEEEGGFIYKTVVDSTLINYGFKHFRIEGDREYVFQTSMIGTFSQEAVEKMYEAVQPQVK